MGGREEDGEEQRLQLAIAIRTNTYLKDLWSDFSAEGYIFKTLFKNPLIN